MVNSCVNIILNRLFPHRCVCCGALGEKGRNLCPGCLADLPLNRHCCPRCALPLQPGTIPLEPCGRCLRRPPPFRQALIPYRYEGDIREMILGLKFHHQLHLATLLGDLLADRIEHLDRELPAAIIPVPLHPGRIRERGYNQAQELAKVVARRLRIPIDNRSAIRILPTLPQAELAMGKRSHNLRGAFRIKERVPAARLAIVDDVVTTGATATELAKVLRAAGAQQVDLWAVARTPDPAE